MKYSILLSTLNRADLIAETLKSFEQLVVDNCEVQFVIVDNGSTDETQRVLREWESRLPLLSIYEPTAGKNICLNRAIEHATGDYVIFTDDDVVADPNWITAYHAAVKRWPEELLFGGAITPRFPPGTPTWVATASSRHAVLYSEYSPAGKEGPTESIPIGPNMMVKQSVFERFRFDESIGPAGKNYAMGSETEFLVRVKANTKCNYMFVPESHVQHVVRDEQITEKWIAGRAFRAGRGMARSITTDRLKIAGVPWPIWFRYIRSRVTKLIRRNQKISEDFDSVWNQIRLEGCIHEFRELNAHAESKRQELT